MLRLKSDLLPALIATADGVLKTFDLRWHDDAALTVVMAAKGYPGDYAKGSRDQRPRCGARRRGRGDLPRRHGARGRPPARRRRPRAQRHGARARPSPRRSSAPIGPSPRSTGRAASAAPTSAGARCAREKKGMSAIARPVPRLRRAAHQDQRGVEIFLRTGGAGPPLLLLHGYPQTHVGWHRVAPELARHCHAGDRRPARLRRELGPGRRCRARDSTPSARWPQDCLAVMRALGHQRFIVAGHDRGGRVAYRLALDHPEAVAALVPIDIIPTGEVWRRDDARRARSSPTTGPSWRSRIPCRRR